MVPSPCRDGVREVPATASPRAGRVPPGGVGGGPDRRLLPRVVRHVALPLRDVPVDPRHDRLHHLRIRGDEQGRGGGGVGRGVQGVPAQRLLGVAAEEGGELGDVEGDRRLLEGRKSMRRV